MKLTIERKWKKEAYTIGRLYVNGEYFCNTLEDTDRGLKQSDPLEYIKKKKVYGETAIPEGVYKIAMNIVSPKYKSVKWYYDFNGGKMPRIIDVPGYEGVLIHPGNTALDALGCILVGKNTTVGRLTQSRVTFTQLYTILQKAHETGEEITLEYV